MSVRKRRWKTASGERREAWLVDYNDQAGERRFSTFARKKEADDYHATVRVDVAAGKHTPPSKSLTVAEAGEAWIERVQADGRERTTVRQYRQHLDLHIKPRLGAAKISQLNVSRCEAFRTDLLAGVNRPTARKVLTSLKSILKGAQHAHVMEGVSVPRNKRAERKIEVGIDFPTPAEIKRITNAAPAGRMRSLILVAATCGLRASELRGLRWRDVDLKGSEPSLHIRQRADRYGTIGQPKTDSSVRTVPLVPQAVEELRTWKLASGRGDDDLVFPTSTGRAEHHANMLRSVHAVMTAAGVVDKATKEPKYALHAFRHFFASWCLNRVSAGGLELPPNEVQALLGHSSIVMTLDVYGHLFKGKSDAARLAAASAALFA
jgi:integrase